MMQNNLSQKVQTYIKTRTQEKRWKRFTAALACAVVLCTMYALVLPALTMTGTTYCGLEAHTHTNICYAQLGGCKLEEHQHSLACFSDPNAKTARTNERTYAVEEVASSATSAEIADETAGEAAGEAKANAETFGSDTTDDNAQFAGGSSSPVSEEAYGVSAEDGTSAAANASTEDSASAENSAFTENSAEPALQAASLDEETESITAGETKTITVAAGQTVKLSFVPQYTHPYVFYSSANGDTYGYLYDANGKQLSSNDDGGYNRNFKIEYSLTAGETYYWGARWYGSNTTGDIPVTLELGTHSYSVNEQGNIVCSICGAAAPTSGTCGNSLTWAFDKETQTLSITGTGAMTNYSSSSKAPWDIYASFIKKVSIAEGVTSVGSYAFANCKNVTELRLEAANTTFVSSQSKINSDLQVTIANTVDTLLADTITTLTTLGCNSITFEGPSYLEAGGWQADFLPEQLKGLPQAQYFIDEQGVFYRIDSETNTASVFYCPASLETYTVLKELPALDALETTIPVTGVDSLAFNNATKLTTLTFENPAAITSLDNMAFSGAVSLESINGQTSSTKVLSTFTSSELKAGTMLFGQTKITGTTEQVSADALVVEKDNLKLSISTEKSKYIEPGQADNGTFLYYTGETAQTTITVSNPDSSEDSSGSVIRAYFGFDDKNGNISYAPGTYTVVSAGGNKYTMTVVKTETTGVYYVELEKPQKGDTISIIIESSYSSPSSAGGTAAIWGAVLTADEKESVAEGLVPVSSYQSLNWSTVPDTFPITKKEATAGASQLKGDGTGGAYISGLTYSISMSREGTTLEGVGKDYMTWVDFQDVLTLPQDAVLANDVLSSIQSGSVKFETVSGSSGGYVFKTAEGRTFLTITPNNASTNYRYLESGSVSVDEKGNLVVGWRFLNSDLKTEIADTSFTYKVGDNVILVPNPQADKVYVVDNSVTANEHFMYSANQVQTGECSANVKVASSSLRIIKNNTKYNSLFGEERTFTITASNPGALPYEKLGFITDNLPSQFYMRPADLAAAFADDTQHQLTVTVNYATLCNASSGKSVTGIDGSTAMTRVQNSGGNAQHSGMSSTDSDAVSNEASTLVFSWAANGLLQITVDEQNSYSCAVDASAIQQVLESIGFTVTSKTQYGLKWDLRNADGTAAPLVGGGTLEKTVYCTNKDTFMLLDNDTSNRYPDQSQSCYNYGNGLDANENKLTSDSLYVSNTREFSLYKNWSMNGETIDGETNIQEGTVLDYTLSVGHAGSAQYDALPLVDHMSGTQALLVPAEKNSTASWAQGLQTVSNNGVSYYVLSTPGTYNNVWTSEEHLANSVEVTKTSSGLDTLITWYFTNYTGSRTDTISYHSYFCPRETADGALSYSLGNETWLNDHQSHRLYATLPVWAGTAFTFDKEIVSAVGDTGEGTRYSTISEGQTVVYRLELSSPTDKEGNKLPLTITGADMYDALPLSNSTYRWSSENVRVTYEDSYAVTNGESWSIDEPNEADQQYLRWADDFSITFTGTAYIYVELDFPADIPWQEYASKYGTAKLTNTFHVLSAQRSVTHEVSIAAQVRLQKGVFDTGYYYGSSSSSRVYLSDMSAQDDRLYYQNKDTKIRAVKYYAALYNNGPTNLYLTDMQDLLPRGFTFASVSTYYGTASVATDTGTGTDYVDVKHLDNTRATKKVATVKATTSTADDERQLVTFSFTRPSNSASYVISYDEERGMCYLKPGEAITFVYVCATNESQDSDDAALNTLTMPYYDFNNGGVEVTDQCTITAPKSSTYTQNNGGCDVLDNGQAESLGFAGQTDDTQWLASEVTLIRGGIKPGITKELTSKTDQNGTTTLNPVSAASSDTLNWSITTENDGTNSIVDYVLADQMQSPYMFTGTVSYQIYNNSSAKSAIAWPYKSYLFTISAGSDDNHLLIKTNSGNSAELTIGGPAVALKCDWYYSAYNEKYSTTKYNVPFSLSIAKDESGNATLYLRLSDSSMAIPEGGKSVLTLSTYNATNTLENRQYVNTCFIAPLQQTWDNTTNKGNVVSLETPFGTGATSTVRNSTPVTTSYGYVTDSSKSVTEVDNTSNTATCTDETNYIALSDRTKKFTYTLTVNNSTPKAMDMLVLIDSLPQVGDHTLFLESDERFSEFKVSLAQDPEFTVTVTNSEGVASTLDASDYTLEYSENTEFTSQDWAGTSTWSESAEGARSIRLKISDAAGTLIPKGSTVALSFTCEVDDPNVQPGQVAWNSFGYHYRLLGEVVELEAAPLKVGVKVPSVPELQKKVVDHAGQARAVEQDETFNFLVYPGSALDGAYTTRDEWIAALGDTPYEEFSVTLAAGESLSGSVRMQTDKWTWEEGQKYTVVELPRQEDMSGQGDYSFKRFEGCATNSYTFTYAQAQTQVVTCENTALCWSIDLTKQNTLHEALGGAVFALYSPDSADQLATVPQEYADLALSLSLEHAGKTWYLKDIETTPDSGKLAWSDLLQEEYYLLEVKAPDGYNLSSVAGQVIKQARETQGVYAVTVTNRSGYSLPESGGVGTTAFTLAGSLLLAVGVLLFYHRFRRGKESE